MNVSAISSASFAGNPERISKLPRAEQAKAASQFEAIIIRQMLQDSVGKIMQPGSGDQGGGIYGYMLTDMLASKIAEGGGLGLGKIISSQLTPHAPAAEGKENS